MLVPARRIPFTFSLLFTVFLTVGYVLTPIATLAQHRHSFLHRHSKLVGAAAGVAAYKAAKHTGHNRAAHGGHCNFAQRHPVLTGIATGIAAHHLAKKHR